MALEDDRETRGWPTTEPNAGPPLEAQCAIPLSYGRQMVRIVTKTLGDDSGVSGANGLRHARRASATRRAIRSAVRQRQTAGTTHESGSN